MRPALSLKQSANFQLKLNGFGESTFQLRQLLNDRDPKKAVQTGKLMAKAWVNSRPEETRFEHARGFLFCVIDSFWNEIHSAKLLTPKLPQLNDIIVLDLDETAVALAIAIGKVGARFNVIDASFELGNFYTSMMPEDVRSSNGTFYTPPELCERLLNLSEIAGIDWKTSKVIDPACGGGAFLAPVAIKMALALVGHSPRDIISHIETHLQGYEIDTFGAWLTQVFVEVALRDLLCEGKLKLKSLITVCDSLKAPIPNEKDKFDLVIGNPPYGKVKLSDSIRSRYKKSLYGHANYYGLFTHLATDLVKKDGVISFLTPTSFLSGEYFKNLRRLLRVRSQPMEIDFVDVRKGIFEDVLQETMLCTYKKNPINVDQVSVNQITTLPDSKLKIIASGYFKLTADLSAPWILPRTPDQASAVTAMKKMQFTLKDYGYKVSTGPLVWNRHKNQLHKKAVKDSFPIIWSEAVTRDGKFILRSDKRNHFPYFKFEAGNESLLVRQSCILLQRTTAKEQDKRLIAAVLPKELLADVKCVVVENHLNMILPSVNGTTVSLNTLCVLLNSRAVNEAFRTISGSVAVSAYELECLPLPNTSLLGALEKFIADGNEQHRIEDICHKIYHDL